MQCLPRCRQQRRQQDQQQQQQQQGLLAALRRQRRLARRARRRRRPRRAPGRAPLRLSSNSTTSGTWSSRRAGSRVQPGSRCCRTRRSGGWWRWRATATRAWLLPSRRRCASAPSGGALEGPLPPVRPLVGMRRCAAALPAAQPARQHQSCPSSPLTAVSAASTCASRRPTACCRAAWTAAGRASWCSRCLCRAARPCGMTCLTRAWGAACTGTAAGAPHRLHARARRAARPPHPRSLSCPQGDVVAISPFESHLDPRLYGGPPAPDIFDPTRCVAAAPTAGAGAWGGWGLLQLHLNRGSACTPLHSVNAAHQLSSHHHATLRLQGRHAAGRQHRTARRGGGRGRPAGSVVRRRQVQASQGG